MTVLTDTEIRDRIWNGGLIVGGTDDQIGPACYELRMGNVYYDLTESIEPINVKDGQSILIKLGHRVVLVTMESVKIPNNIIARVASKGSLFSIGLSAVNTYADPGFKGEMGIVTENISDKYIELPIGAPIAKMDFALLSGYVEKPYEGQHGLRSKMWPIRLDLQKTHAQVKFDDRVKSEIEEGYKLLPLATANLLRSIVRRQRFVDVVILAAMLGNAIILSVLYTKFIDLAWAIGTNVLSTFIAASLMWFVPRKT